jgi:hypothetical protein
MHLVGETFAGRELKAAIVATNRRSAADDDWPTLRLDVQGQPASTLSSSKSRPGKHLTRKAGAARQPPPPAAPAMGFNSDGHGSTIRCIYIP